MPPDLDPRPGDLVLVPLNRRQIAGVVWDGTPDGTVPDRKLKPLGAMLDAPPMPAPLRRFVDWMAAYTLAMPGEVLAMALRVNALHAAAPSAGWRLAGADAAATHALARSAARQRVAALLGRRRRAHDGRDRARSRGWRGGGARAWRRPG